MPQSKTISVSLSKSDILTAALVGLGIQKQKVEAAIATLKAELEQAPAPKHHRRAAARKPKAASPTPPPAAHPAAPKKRRTMSAAGKASIRKALAARWAAYHKAQKKLHK